MRHINGPVQRGRRMPTAFDPRAISPGRSANFASTRANLAAAWTQAATAGRVAWRRNPPGPHRRRFRARFKAGTPSPLPSMRAFTSHSLAIRRHAHRSSGAAVDKAVLRRRTAARPGAGKMILAGRPHRQHAMRAANERAPPYGSRPSAQAHRRNPSWATHAIRRRTETAPPPCSSLDRPCPKRRQCNLFLNHPLLNFLRNDGT
jgi:hypothetical protein